MTRPKIVWTAEEIEKASRHYAKRLPDIDDVGRNAIVREIAAELGCLYLRVENRLRNYGPTFNRGVDGEIINSNFARGPQQSAVSADLIIDRDRRSAALDARTVTGVFCGDPPVGFSALDRRDLSHSPPSIPTLSAVTLRQYGDRP